MKRYLLALLLAFPLAAADLVIPPVGEVLPPLIPWSGKSESLIAASNDPWITPSEKSGLRTTPDYDQTVAWLRKLVSASQHLKMISIGTSPEGREIWMVVASKEGSSTPEGLRRNGRPTVLAHSGIHSGEIDGKDAGMMLLRDMTVRGVEKRLLDRANFLFIPILSVDAHERASRYSRINQRGPEVSGWRTNARNLNLNRDYAKVDTVEIRSLIAAIRRWDPDLYLDLHVTDGADYQYDITYGFNRGAWSPAIGEWLSSTLTAKLDYDLAAWGHIPGPLIFNVADDFSKGISGWISSPRFSTGYGDVIHLPTVLVENHSLKPYRQRVLGTYILLRSALESAGDSAQSLRAAIDADMKRRTESIPLSWRVPDSGPEQIEIEAIRSRQRLSEITGSMVTDWLGEPETITVDYHVSSEVATSIARPKAWWVPPAWPEVIERLDLHGIRYERITAPREVEVEMYRLVDPKIESAPVEGHVRVGSGLRSERRTWRFPTNSLRVPADQPLGTLAAILLEPGSGDSLFQWGFMLEILSRTEYVEAYVMEPMARRMLEANPSLRAEFEEKLESDVAFRGNPDARLRWFYEKTPWFDERWKLYPIGRETE
jgi:hypothetical protein